MGNKDGLFGDVSKHISTKTLILIHDRYKSKEGYPQDVTRKRYNIEYKIFTVLETRHIHNLLVDMSILN